MSVHKLEDCYAFLGAHPKYSIIKAEEAFGEKVIEWDHRLYVQRSELCDKLDRLRTMTDILTYPRASKAYDQEQIDNYDDLPLTRTLTNVENSDEQLREQLEAARKSCDETLRSLKKMQLKMDYHEKQIDYILAEYNLAQTKNLVQIKWKVEKDDLTNGGYTKDLLNQILTKYDVIDIVVFSPKIRGTALVQFTCKRAAKKAIQFEKGLPENPLSLKLV